MSRRHILVGLALILALLLALSFLLREDNHSIALNAQAPIMNQGGLLGGATFAPVESVPPVPSNPLNSKSDPPRGLSLFGQVFNRLGESQPGCTITLKRLNPEALDGRLSDTHDDVGVVLVANSDSSGKFRFETLEGGTYLVMAQALDQSASALVKISDSSGATVTLILTSTGTIIGRVVDEGGRAIANAPITPYMFNSTFLSATRATVFATTTSSEGSFSLRNLERGSWRLLIDPPGFTGTLTDEVLPDTEPLLVRLRRGGDIYGILTSSTSALVLANIQILLQPTSFSGRIRHATTDENGEFQFSGLSHLDYYLTMDAPSYVLDGAPIRVTEMDHGDHILLTASPSSSLRGFVRTSTEEAVGNARVLLQGSGLTRRVEVFSAYDGSFEINGIDGGTYSLYAWRSNNRTSATRRETILLAEAEELDNVILVLEDRVGLSGRVLDSSGLPVSGARVEAKTHSTEAGTEGHFNVSSDEFGEFEIFGFWGGQRIELRAKRLDVASSIQGPLHLPAQGLLDVVLELVETANSVVTGLLKNAEGTVMPNSKLWITRRGSSLDSQFVETDETGRFLLTNMAIGEYSIHYKLSTHETVFLRNFHVSDSERLELELIVRQGDVGELTGFILDTSGYPLSGAAVTASLLHDGGMSLSKSALSDVDGNFAMHLAVGSYWLTVSLPNHKTETVIGVVPGTIEQPIVLEAL